MEQIYLYRRYYPVRDYFSSLVHALELVFA